MLKALLSFLLHAAAAVPLVDLFVANTGFPTCYRQPVLVAINSTHLLAFAEGRDNGGYCSGAADGTNSSIWVRSSHDAGSTWAPAIMLFDAPPMPDYLSAVHDEHAGRTLLLIQTTPNLISHSDDAGKTWSKPAPLAITLPAGYTASPGVAHGIQLRGDLCAEPTCGGAAGRLVVAWVCHGKKGHAAAPQAASSDVSCPGCYSCLATSDDGGAHWAVAPGAISLPQEGSREASLVQLRSAAHASASAVVYATERNMGSTPGHRWHAVSVDGGRSLSIFGNDSALPDGDTKNWTGIVAGAARIGESVFVSTPQAVGERADMALFRSNDEAGSWGAGKLFQGGPAGYSDMAALNSTHGAVLFENGAKEFAAKISFAVFEAAVW
jgi:photosystem II stability/assembly factor-like uncharacterized protein